MDLSTQSLRGAPIFVGWGAALVCGLLFTGCKREEIRVYSVPKEQPTQMASSAEHVHGSDPGVPHVHFKIPAGWTEQQPGGMRAARLSAPAKQGPELDISVIPLPGVTASKTDIVNLWREQVRLGPIKEDDLAGITEKIKIGSDGGEMFDMASTNNVIEDKYRAGILVAMLRQNQTTWFFKMTGEAESVGAQKAAFIDFLKSVQIDYSSHAEGTQTLTSGNPKDTGAQSRPAWEVPSSWREVPPPQMLLAKFVMPDPKQPKAEVTVSVFPGDAGGVLPNINRWRRQIKLEPLLDDALAQVTTPLDVPGRKAILVDMSGHNTEGQPTRIIGAILPADERTWFYKLTGDPQIAQQEKDAFVQFVQTAKYANVP